MESWIRELIKRALKERENAYCPYSGYRVGAALLSKRDKIFCGCNVENASYGATMCAERTAFFRAVSDGERDFKAIAITGGIEEDAPSDYAYPCGLCRQVMAEFCTGDFQVIVAKSETEYQIFYLKDLLPFGFGKDKLL